MEGLKVKCPNCKRMDFVTTNQYDPEKLPNGSMVRCLLPYHIDWLCSSATYAAQMTCPECTCQLAPYGRLTLVEPVPPINVPGNCGAPTGVCPAAEALAAMEEREYPDDPPGANDVTEEDLEMVAKLRKSLVCDVCGKECKSQFGLNSHKRSHK